MAHIYLVLWTLGTISVVLGQDVGFNDGAIHADFGPIRQVIKPVEGLTPSDIAQAISQEIDVHFTDGAVHADFGFTGQVTDPFNLFPVTNSPVEGPATSDNAQVSSNENGVLFNDGIIRVDIRSNDRVNDRFNLFPVAISRVEGQTTQNIGQANYLENDVIFRSEQLNHEKVEANSSTSTMKPVKFQNNIVNGLHNSETIKTDVVDGTSPDQVSKEETFLSSLITDFGLRLGKMIHQQGEQDTILFSPLSICTLMTLLMGGMGKQSKTYNETYELLGYDNASTELRYLQDLYAHFFDKEEIIHLHYGKLLTSLSIGIDKIIFKMGNQVFLQNSDRNTTNILSSFMELAKDYYNAGIQNLNFYSDPIGAANIINGWVNNTTNGKIPKLITDPISPLTKFMAVNTVYFKAPWKYPFSTSDTIVQTFDTGSEKIDIPFMIKMIGVKVLPQISDSFNATMVELPYKGNRYSMYIIKPNGPASLDSVLDIEAELNANTISYLVSNIQKSQTLPVWIEIPRMRLRYRTYLKDVLEEMGASSMFSIKDADFSRITSDNHPVLDNMIHEAVMDITEEGTEAAAATSTVHNRFGTNFSFVLDRPSLLFIYDSKTKIPIFWARLVTPKSI